MNYRDTDRSRSWIVRFDEDDDIPLFEELMTIMEKLKIENKSNFLKLLLKEGLKIVNTQNYLSTYEFNVKNYYSNLEDKIVVDKIRGDNAKVLKRVAKVEAILQSLELSQNDIYSNLVSLKMMTSSIFNTKVEELKIEPIKDPTTGNIILTAYDITSGLQSFLPETIKNYELLTSTNFKDITSKRKEKRFEKVGVKDIAKNEDEEMDDSKNKNHNDEEDS
jgi:hypothetical protein